MPFELQTSNARSRSSPRHDRTLELDPLLKRTRAELEETLGEETFAAAWERGQSLDPAAVAEEVLEWLESAA